MDNTAEPKYTTLEDIEARWRNMPRIKKIWLAIKCRVFRAMDFPYHIRKARWFIQRGKRGYADCDWWEMHSYLVRIILPMLRRMRVDNTGYPGYGQASTPEKWEGLLDEMIEGFEAGERILNDGYYKEVSGDSIEAIHNATSEEVRQWREMAKADQKIFNKKVKVFTKWFFHLWD